MSLAYPVPLEQCVEARMDALHQRVRLRAVAWRTRQVLDKGLHLVERQPRGRLGGRLERRGQLLHGEPDVAQSDAVRREDGRRDRVLLAQRDAIVETVGRMESVRSVRELTTLLTLR